MIKNYSALNYNLQILSKIKEICNPLFNQSCIKSFRYFRVFNDGFYINISTDHEWLCQRVLIPNNGESFHKPLCEASEDKLLFYLWDNNSNDIIMDLFKKYNILNGITAYKRKESSVEAWSFGATPEDNFAHNFYINNINFLSSFIKYFNSTANDLINISNISSLAKFSDFISIDFPKRTNNYYNENYYYFIDKKKDLITKREMECLMLVSMGKTFKETARLMNISPRTVESHIKKIKCKLGKNNKSNIIDYFWKNFSNKCENIKPNE